MLRAMATVPCSGRARQPAIVAAGVAAALVAFSGATSAFDYTEHAHISHLAIALATTGCPDEDAASCTRARELADALRAQLDEPLLCASADTVAADQPATCFTLADIPALAGDHAASPLLTRWRWLDPTQPSRKQGGLVAAFPGVIAMFDTSSRSPETERLYVPDRSGFLAYIRGYAPAHWPLTAGPSDLGLEQYDGNYIGLAERGHPHFRPRLAGPHARIQAVDHRSAYLAALRYLTHYTRYEPSRLRSKPDTNAFAWYADQHLGALRMAHAASLASADDRQLLLATAMFLELNAWHYLEDSVASGHMIGDANSPSGALNNGALTATHNEYCAGLPGQQPPRRVDVRVPRGLCHMLAEHHWEGQLRQLAAVCADPLERIHSIYGDHVIATSGTVVGSLLTPKDQDPRTFDAIVTENWAAALAGESYREVARASAGDDFGSFPAHDALVDCGHEDHWTTDPAYTWGYAPTEVRLYQCLFAWWEGDRDDEHGLAISSLLPGPAFRALSLVPVPEPRDDQERYPEESFFSGNSVSLSVFGYGYSRSASSIRGVARSGLALQYLIVAPRTLLPIQIAIGPMFETALESPLQQRLGADLTVRYDYASFSKLYFGASGQLAYVLGAEKWDGAGDAIPLGFTWLDRNSLMSNLEIRAGFDSFFGWRAGLSASLAFF
jgi:hypothetical protein